MAWTKEEEPVDAGRKELISQLKSSAPVIGLSILVLILVVIIFKMKKKGKP